MSGVFCTVKEAIDVLQAGRFVIVVDDERRENEGDLVIAAQHIDERKMAFLIRHTGGVVCLALTNPIADQLELPPMVAHNTSRLQTAFTVSIEAAEGIATGISAKDRAHTVLKAVSPVAKPQDLSRPGHVFPLRARDGGVLVRAGHTEASTDLCRLSGLREGAVISEMMHEDGSMMRLPAIESFSKEHDIPILKIADLIAYRQTSETLVRRESEADLETETGVWRIVIYSDMVHAWEHAALVKGNIDPQKPALVRVHSECLTGDTFGSLHCDCGAQLHQAMTMIEREGTGAILYLRQEGRGIGLANKIRAYALQQTEGLDTVEANVRLGFPMDLREYGIGAQILRDLGFRRLKLLTNNPRKLVGLQGYGLEVESLIPIELQKLSIKQRRYLETKVKKMGHLLKMKN